MNVNGVLSTGHTSQAPMWKGPLWQTQAHPLCSSWQHQCFFTADHESTSSNPFEQSKILQPRPVARQQKSFFFWDQAASQLTNATPQLKVQPLSALPQHHVFLSSVQPDRQLSYPASQSYVLAR